MGWVLPDPWHPFSAQGKDVLPSNLLGPGTPLCLHSAALLYQGSVKPCYLPPLPG